MISHQCKIRVLYPDTDKMGYVHHSNYARYCEKARWELLRELGITYKEIEDSGIMLPVVGMSFKYLKPAVYDELLRIETELKEIKTSLYLGLLGFKFLLIERTRAFSFSERARTS